MAKTILKRAAVFIVLSVFASHIASAKDKTEAAHPAEQKNAVKPLFYPLPPEEPRLQFLKSFSSSDDFEKPTGKFRKFIVGVKKKSKPIVKPYGVTVHDKKIYICDTVRGGIDILDFNTREFRYFEPSNSVELVDPIHLDFDPEGNMYVADARRGQIVIFDKEENYVGTLGEKAEFKPTDLVIKNDKIFVCDLKTHSVRVYGLQDHKYLMSIPPDNVKPEGKLFSPTNLASDLEGNIYVSDFGGFRVQKYSPFGEYLLTIGSHGDAFGQFARPKGLAVDKQGNIFIVDAAFENVQIFDKTGKLLLFFGGPAEKRDVSLVLPAAIALDESLVEYFTPLISPDFEVDFLVLVTSQYGERKLSVFGFGRKKT